MQRPMRCECPRNSKETCGWNRGRVAVGEEVRDVMGGARCAGPWAIGGLCLPLRGQQLSVSQSWDLLLGQELPADRWRAWPHRPASW